MAALGVADHTAIVSFCVTHRDELRKERRMSPAALLKRASAISTDNNLRALLAKASGAATEVADTARKANAKDAAWRAAAPVIKRILLSDGDAAALIAVLKSERRAVDTRLRVGIDVGIDCLTQGATTIYNPEFWVAEREVTPADVFFYQTREALLDEFRTAVSRVGYVAKMDAIGATAAVAGAIAAGEVKPGPLPQVAAQLAKIAAGGAVAASAEAVFS